ncbi:MAG: hypothetical protein JNJ59_18190 [Deltaproteobacteria bacterium]|nr:hypothetical protein [Deltaproteobacteria bacterium]
MTAPTTFTGKNLETALQKASQATGLAPEAIKYEILAGKTGGYALIKVIGQAAAVPTGPLVESLSGDPNAAAPARADRGDRGDRGDRPPRDRDRGGDRGPRPERSGDRGGDRGPRPERSGDRGPRPDRGDRGDRGPRPERGGDRGPRRRDDRDELLPVPQDGPTAVTFEVAAEGPLTAFGEKVRDVLVATLEKMGFGMKLVFLEGADEVQVDLVSGVYHDVLLAKELELLDALEHLVEKVAIGHGNLPEGAPKKKVHLDSNGFRAKADLDLAHSAREMADRAIADQRVFKLGPLDPRARRVVHLTLREYAGVVTRSEGEGVFRRVCIIPKSAEATDNTSVQDDHSGE